MLKKQGCWNCDHAENCSDYYWTNTECYRWKLSRHESESEKGKTCTNCYFNDVCRSIGAEGEECVDWEEI